jgi:DNA-directed RNA polymerase subunit M/transcription elongation factor TFIIS
VDSKPINVITVLCDTRRMQTIALTCRCGTRWTERVPGELHDSQMIAQFECPKCGQAYHLHNKTLHRVQEDSDARQQKQPFAAIKPTSRFDA